jgi:hypothetical protein
MNCNCNWTPRRCSTLGSYDRPIRQEHAHGCNVTVNETFYCIIYSSYTDMELTNLDRLSALTDRILT